MSELTEFLTVAESAATMQFADAEIKGFEELEDGSTNLTVNVSSIKEQATCHENKDAQPDDEGTPEETTDEQGDAREDDDAEDTPDKLADEMPGILLSQGGRGVETVDMEHNELTALAGQINTQSDHWEYPEDTTSEGIRQALKSADISTARSAAREAGLGEYVITSPESDESEGTPASGGVEKVEGEERTTWIVNGSEHTHNDLQKAVSDMDTPWPADSSGDHLAEMVANAGEHEEDTTETTDEQPETDETEDTPDETETEFDGELPLSEAKLLEEGVPQKDVEKAQSYQDRNGLCAGEGCFYGANKNCKFCPECEKEHDTDDSPSGSNDEQSIADEVKEVAEIFGVSNTEAREAIEAKNNGHFATTKEALDQL